MKLLPLFDNGVCIAVAIGTGVFGVVGVVTPDAAVTFTPAAGGLLPFC